jgi:predicted nuclease with TOPRIM domain
MNDLEVILKETQSERDELKVRVARLEGELEALKGLLKR